MDEIPADIEQTATRFSGEYLASDISCARVYRDVVKLLIAERQRCAQAARDYLAAEYMPDFGSLPDDIAAAILAVPPGE